MSTPVARPAPSAAGDGDDRHPACVRELDGVDQKALVRALAEPAFHPHRPHAVEHLQTHVSHVFLAGPHVYKLKKAVRFPFLDFSTRDLRRQACEDEIRLNRRLAPEVYLDVVPIVRTANGALRLGGEGDVVDHVVHMRRLPADRMLPALLAAGAVSDEMLDALACRLAAFHAQAPAGPDIAAHAGPEALAARWETEARDTMPFVGELLAAEDHEVLRDFGTTFVRTHETLLRARQERGRIREGHGDLHAEHVCFVETPVPAEAGAPALAPDVYVFDCIEFSRAFRCNDVASEVAFLAMDLESRGHRERARRFVAAYADAARDPLVPALVPFYACHRAIVRGKVEGLASRAAELDVAARKAAARRARHYFALAVQYAWRAGPPAVIACCGLAGSGKTALATEIALTADALLVSSDAIRKRDAAAKPAYTAAARAAVYALLFAETDAALAAGRTVVADATFIRAADRARLAAAAARHAAPLVFVECHADAAVVRARLAARDRSPSLSDARWDTYVGQRAGRDPVRAAEPAIAVDTTGDLAAARAAALRRLWQWRQGRPA